MGSVSVEEPLITILYRMISSSFRKTEEEKAEVHGKHTTKRVMDLTPFPTVKFCVGIATS